MTWLRCETLVFCALMVAPACAEDDSGETGGVSMSGGGEHGSTAEDSGGTTNGESGSGEGEGSGEAGTSEPSTGSGTGGAGCDEMGGVVLTLEREPSDLGCMEAWQEAGTTLQTIDSGHPTCGTGSCFGEATGESVWVYPAELSIDLTMLECAVGRVEADIQDYGSKGFLVLYDNGQKLAEASTNTSEIETVVVSAPAGAPITTIGIQGCETRIDEIRLY